MVEKDTKPGTPVRFLRGDSVLVYIGDGYGEFVFSGQVVASTYSAHPVGRSGDDWSRDDFEPTYKETVLTRAAHDEAVWG